MKTDCRFKIIIPELAVGRITTFRNTCKLQLNFLETCIM